MLPKKVYVAICWLALAAASLGGWVTVAAIVALVALLMFEGDLIR